MAFGEGSLKPSVILATMRQFVLFLSLSVCSVTGLDGSASTSIALTPTTGSALLGQTVTINGSVTPAFATGLVTFYDGARVLGTARLAGGTASFTTRFLPSGQRTLTAYYQGDTSYSPSTSPAVLETIKSVAGGGFAQLTPYQDFSYSSAVAVGDFNEDGKPDMIASYSDSSTLSNREVAVFLGVGDGTFTPGPVYSGSQAFAFATGDFNGDGHMDLAVLTSAQVDIYLGTGTGTFLGPKSFPSTPGGFPPDGFQTAFVVGDFNRDGFSDIATITNPLKDSSHGLSVLLGKGDGSFGAPVFYNVGAFPSSLTLADFNADGFADLAVTDSTGGNVNILMGRGDGTFQLPSKLPVPGAQSVVAADFNKDGKIDLAVVTLGSLPGLNYSILAGKGDGTFGAAANYSLPDLTREAGAASLAVEDFDGDGQPDLVVGALGLRGAPDSVCVLAGNGDGTFRLVSVTPTGNGTLAFVTADFNGDSRADILTYSSGVQTVGVLLALPPSGFKVGTASILPAIAGIPYTYTLSAIGGVPPYKNWTLSGGALPPFLLLTSDGTIAGTPVSNIGSPFTFSVTVQDSSGATSPAQSFSMTVAPPVPSITPGGIAPLFSRSPSIEAGSWITIYGNNLAPGTATWNGEYPSFLGGVTVSIDGKQGYLAYVSPNQINLEAPDDMRTGSVPVVVSNIFGSASSTVFVSQAGASLNQIGNYAAGIIPNPNGSYDLMGPVGAFTTPSRPVKQGEILVLYGTGFGATSPPVPAGMPLFGPPVPVKAATVRINGLAANVLFAGIVSPGVYQFNIVVPSTGPGNWPLQVGVSGPTFSTSISGPLIAVQ